MMRSLVIVVLVAAAAFTGCAASAPATRAPATLPAVSLLGLDGRAVDLAAAVRGRPTLLSLWATWCGPCVEEIPALERLDPAARAGGGQVLAVAVGEPRAKVAAFSAARHLGYAQLVDEEFRLADGLGVRRVPTTLVLDRDGRVVYTGGALDEAALEALRPLLTKSEAK